MKLLIVLALVGLAVARPLEFLEGDEQAYNDVMDNKRLLGAYVDCFLEKGPCTSQGKRLKDILSELVDSSCGECSETDKRRAGKALVAVKKNYCEKYEALIKKYDPEGKKLAELAEFEKQYES